MKKRQTFIACALITIPFLASCKKTSHTLSKIEIKEGAKIAYAYGESFVKPSVQAYYEDNTSEDVSSKVTFSEFKPTQVGSQKITASYTEADITKTTEYTVTVAEAKVALKFAIFADVQLCAKEAGTGKATNLGETANASSALETHLKFCKENNIKLVLMNGDITNQENANYYDYFDEILKKVYGDDATTYPEFIWNMGNHEWWGGTTETESTTAIETFKARNHSSSIEKYIVAKSSATGVTAKGAIPSFYAVINGIPILTLSGSNSNGLINDTFKGEIENWLSQAKQLASVKRGGPIFIQYHYPLSTSMTHGEGSSSTCTTLENILKDTPNAIVFTGDTHYSGVNERAINQVNFTTINLGTSSYSRMVDKSAVVCSDYYNVSASSASGKQDKMVGNIKYKNAYTPHISVVEVSQDDSCTIDRYFSQDDNGNFAKDRKVGVQWKINPIKSKDDFTYTNARFQNKDASKALYGSECLTWKNGDEVKFAVNTSTSTNLKMTVQFPDVEQYHFVEHYKITINDAQTYDVVSNYYKYENTPENNVYVLENIKSAANYTVKVEAYDYFDTVSKTPLTSNTETPTALVDAIDNQAIKTYCDINTRINTSEKASINSNSSIEYYYRGKYPYNAGATACRIYDKRAAQEKCNDYITLGDETNGVYPTVVASIKNPNNFDIKVGLSVVKNLNGTDQWKDDFDKTAIVIPANSGWTEVSWNLTKYAIHNKSELSMINLKFKSQQEESVRKNGYEMSLLVDNIDIAPKAQSRNIKHYKNTTHDCSSLDIAPYIDLSESETFDIDFKFPETAKSTDHVNFMLGDGWNKYFGYYSIYANHLEGNPEGMTFIPLDDGYVRVHVDPSKLNKIPQGVETPTKINLFYIDTREGYTTTDVDYEFFASSGVEERGYKVIPGFNIDHNFATKPDPNTGKVTIDYKITDTNDDALIKLMIGNWTDYFGYFRLKKTSKTGDWDGVTITDLDDGYKRVEFDFSKITRMGDKASGGTRPTEVKFVFVDGNNTTAHGYLQVVSVE